MIQFLVFTQVFLFFFLTFPLHCPLPFLPPSFRHPPYLPPTIQRPPFLPPSLQWPPLPTSLHPTIHLTAALLLATYLSASRLPVSPFMPCSFIERRGQCHHTVRGCSHMMSTKNEGLQIPHPPCQKKSEICWLPLPPLVADIICEWPLNSPGVPRAFLQLSFNIE